ncbi:MAG: hypothetical protein ACKVOP_01400 [Sphingomonadaceae bacterium]
MTARDALIALASGDAGTGGVLHNARYEGFGTEAYGVAAIFAMFAAAADERFDDASVDDASVIEAPGHIALFGDNRALFADCSEGGIGRIWRLGPGLPGTREPGVSVAFHVDLAQAPGAVFFDAADHPALTTNAAHRVIEAASALRIEGYRTRAFVIRAFGNADAGAALFAIHAAHASLPQNGFVNAAAFWSAKASTSLIDAAGLAGLGTSSWTPRV